MENPLRIQLQDAWQLKTDLQFEKSFALASSLRSQVGLPSHLTQLENFTSLIEAPPRELTVPLLTLLFSHLSRWDHSGVATLALKRLLDSTHAVGYEDFYLYYELGHQSFQKGDYFVALEYFRHARSLAGSPFETLLSTINTLFCLESLGLSQDETLLEVKDLVSHLPARNVARSKSQLQAFRCRLLFRKGDFRSLLTQTTEGPFDQGRYLQEWVRALPYHTYYEPNALDNVDTLLTKSPPQLFASYRFRTMRGLLHPDDKQVEKPSEWADRFYLWVWRWLVSNDPIDLKRISSLITEKPKFVEEHRLTLEDRLLIRNAVSWLNLFEANIALPIIIPQASDLNAYECLQLEYVLVKYFEALVQGDALREKDYKQLLYSSPLFHSPDLLFKSALELSSTFGVASQLKPLVEKLERRRAIPNPLARFLVNLRYGTLYDRKTQLTTDSRAICSALYLLKNRSRVPSEIFMNEVFRISSFNQFDHKVKISNLLSRVKKVVGTNTKIRLASDFVIADGNWNEFSFLIPVIAEPFTLGNHSATEKGSVIAKCPRWEGKLSRKEIEELLQFPRSTINRLLVRWEEAGIVRREGKSKKTRYFRCDQMRNELGRKSI